MIRVSSLSPKAMEFTSFRKKESVSDEELINSVLALEKNFLVQQEGIIFHCLLRNFSNEYANVLFAKDMDSLVGLEKLVEENSYAQAFFSLMDLESTKMNFHTIEKEGFKVPEYFSCIKCGTFSLKSKNDFKDLLLVAGNIERNYLKQHDNTQGHFIGSMGENAYSEITLGKTLGETKEICNGYVGNLVCQPMLEMIDEKSVEIDFWYVIA